MDLLPYSRAARRPSRYASHIITITGETGVGTTSTLKALQDKLGMPWRYVSGGAIMRTFAERLGMTIERFAEHNRAHPEEGWDRQCDEMLAAYGRQNYTLIESRLAHAFVPHAFHVLLVCDVDVRATRRMKDAREDFGRVRCQILARDDDDNRRYEVLYPGCLWGPEDFDLVIDTAGCLQREVAGEVIIGHARWHVANEHRLSHDLLYEPEP